MKSLGKNIKELRKQKKYNQIQLSKLLGVSQTSIAHYEAGTRQPTIDTLILLSDIFDVSIDDLIGHSFIRQSNNRELPIKESLIDSLVNCLTTKNEKNFISIFESEVYPIFDIDTIIDTILKQVMYSIGTLWEKGIITEADEHYSTSIVRKVINYISINNSSIVQSKKAITFSIGSEKHTLGLEMITTYLEAKGVNTVYLGSNVPIRSIDQLIKEYKPNFIFISITIEENMNSLIQFVEHVIEKYNDKLIIGIGGQGYINNKELESNDKVFILRRIEDLKEFLNHQNK